MLRWTILFVLLVGSFASTGSAVADDAADVRKAVETWMSALQAADVPGLAKSYHPRETSFDGVGGLLSEGAHTEASLEAVYEAGFKAELQWKHLEVKVFDKASVVTGYLVGNVNLPGRGMLRDVWRTSVMLVSAGNRWQIVHFHASPVHK